MKKGHTKRLRKRTPTRRRGPGRAERKGLSLEELFALFPDETAARQWFESVRWADGRYCPRCEGENTQHIQTERPAPYHCRDCRYFFSVKTGTAMQGSPIPLRKWAIAFYLMVTNLKGVSSMKLHRDLGITQKSAWYMMHRIREAWKAHEDVVTGPVEVDETYIGGKEKNKHWDKKLRRGRGPVGKAAVVGMKDRPTKRVQAEVVDYTDKETLQHFVTTRIQPGTQVYTDEFRSYRGLSDNYEHETIRHSIGEYVRGMVHTNGIESFWATLKRGYHGTYHKMSKKHLHRYVAEFAGRHNVRSLDTLDQMVGLALGIVGKRLSYRELIGKRKDSR